MNTIEYYLRQLDYYRKLLITNLRSLGIECSDDETLNSLIPKIYRLSSSGEIIVDKFSLTDCKEDAETVQYILDHVVSTGNYTDMAGRFKGCSNIKQLPLYKFNSTTGLSSVDKMFGSDMYDPELDQFVDSIISPVETIDAHGCNLSGNVTWYDETDRYNNVTSINLRDSIFNQRAIQAFTCWHKNPLVVDVTNATYTGTSLKHVLDTKNTTVVGAETLIFEKPLDDLDGFKNLSGLTSFDLSKITIKGMQWNSFLSYCSDLNELKGLESLENKVFSVFDFNNMPSLTTDLIFPSMTLPLTSTKIYNLPKVKIVDLSKIIFTSGSSTNPISLYNIGNNIGTGLSDAELVDSRFVLPDLTNSVITSFCNIGYKNDLIENFILTGFKMSYSSYNSSTYGLGPLYNIFSNCRKLKTIHLESSGLDSASTNSYETFFGIKNNPKLESVYVYLHGNGNVYMNYTYGGTDYFQNNPELRTVTLGLPGFKKVNLAPAISKNVPKLEEFIIKDTIIIALPFSSHNNNPLNSLKKVELINCEHAYTNLISFLYNYNYTTLDISTIDGSVISGSIHGLLGNAINLVNLNFISGIGKKYNTSYKEHYYEYAIDFTQSVALTHDSLMDIINKIYDLNITYNVYDGEGNPGTGTLKSQDLKLGAENLAKLTPEEIAIATNKGWTVS